MFHVRIQATPSTSKMVPVLSRRIYEGMEIPEKETLGEITSGIGKAAMTNETIEICILCGMTDAFGPGEIIHDQKIHDQ